MGKKAVKARLKGTSSDGWMWSNETRFVVDGAGDILFPGHGYMPGCMFEIVYKDTEDEELFPEWNPGGGTCRFACPFAFSKNTTIHRYLTFTSCMKYDTLMVPGVQICPAYVESLKVYCKLLTKRSRSSGPV